MLVGPSVRNAWRCASDQISLVRERRPPRPVAVPAQPEAIEIDLNRTALVVVDMQKDFCSQGGWFDTIGADLSAMDALIDAAAGCVPVLREHGVPVIWVNWGNRPDLANVPPSVFHAFNRAGARLGVGHDPAVGNTLASTAHAMAAGDWGCELVDELSMEPGDLLIPKCRQSGFWETPLDTVLRNLDITTVLIAGVYLDTCVIATMIDGSNAGYDCILLTDCTATLSPKFCEEATLWNIRNVWGFTTTTAELVQGLEGWKSAAPDGTSPTPPSVALPMGE